MVSMRFYAPRALCGINITKHVSTKLTKDKMETKYPAARTKIGSKAVSCSNVPGDSDITKTTTRPSWRIPSTGT